MGAVTKRRAASDRGPPGDELHKGCEAAGPDVGVEERDTSQRLKFRILVAATLETWRLFRPRRPVQVVGLVQGYLLGREPRSLCTLSQ